MRPNTGCDFTFLFSQYAKDTSENILPVLDFVSGEAITVHVYV